MLENVEGTFQEKLTLLASLITPVVGSMFRYPPAFPVIVQVNTVKGLSGSDVDRVLSDVSNHPLPGTSSTVEPIGSDSLKRGKDSYCLVSFNFQNN